MRRLLMLTLLGLLLAAPGIAAPPTIPTSLPYQGLLLDGLGEPRTGSVDLTVRIFDAVVGGTLVYKQSFPAVSLSGGVFQLQLGPAGDATDAPANPLTADLATALAGDAGITAPVRFLELTVGADEALVRTQILASAYALRASSAASADTAAFAADAAAVGGFSSEFVTDFFTYVNSDAGNPPNTDPLEGVLDSDGDGRANFIDSDNDDDGLADTVEFANGTHLNLTTPTITSVVPNSGFWLATTPITVNGTNFQSGMTVSVGAESPIPTVLTATSAQLTVGPQPAGLRNVVVTLANGEDALAANAFNFTSTVNHSVAAPPSSASYRLAVKPGTTEVVLGGLQQYGVGDAQASLTVFPLASRASGQIGVAFDAANRVAGIRCRDLGSSCVVEILVDSDADNALEDETGIPIETLASASATLYAATLTRTAGGGWAAGYLRNVGSGAESVVAYDRNADGDFADAAEKVVVGTALGFSNPAQLALAVDSTGRVALVYPTNLQTFLAFDINGDGDFDDVVGVAFEKRSLGAPFGTGLGAAFDASDHLALAIGAGGTRVLHDRNGDNDFLDPGEENTATGTLADVGIQAGEPLSWVHAAPSSFPNQLFFDVDKNGDGDFGDAGESVTLSVTATLSPLRMVLNGDGLAIMAVSGKLAIGQTD